MSITPVFIRLVTRAFDSIGYRPADGQVVLDIGSGSGTNTILPCLRLLKECRIIATDLSPDLLGLLHEYLVREQLDDRVACVCTDAMRNFFRPESVDMVLGAAILHHLLDPAHALETAYSALKPGGMAIFFEPFEGLAVLRIAFDLILDRAGRESEPLDPRVAGFLTAMSTDYAARAGSDCT